jgi:hypothetical protein
MAQLSSEHSCPPYPSACQGATAAPDSVSNCWLHLGFGSSWLTHALLQAEPALAPALSMRQAQTRLPPLLHTTWLQAGLLYHYVPLMCAALMPRQQRLNMRL